jgi:hypothetical protein
MPTKAIALSPGMVTAHVFISTGWLVEERLLKVDESTKRYSLGSRRHAGDGTK